MNISFFSFPKDQAVIVIHPDFTDDCGLIAIVSPTFTPAIHYVGVADVSGRHWSFVNGPARVKTSSVWRWLFNADKAWKCSTSTILDRTDDWSIPAQSPDHLIDLVTGRVAP
jgi:hypothetical protein